MGHGRRRFTIVVLDSVGVGFLPDAEDYGDVGAATLPHVAEAVGGLQLDNMGSWGLGNVVSIQGTPPVAEAEAAFGKMAEQSQGKDTMVGHWEIAGLVTHEPLSLWPEGFPADVVAELEAISGRKVLGNKPASGTAIIEELGREHLETGGIIVYTSADSVLQIAAHEKVVPLEELYRICEETRRRIADPRRIGRVIARPFVGEPGSFQRTYNRRDFPMAPPGKTILDAAVEAGVHVIGVGKIHDIFAGRSIQESVHTEGNTDGIRATLELLRRDVEEPTLLFVNLVDFDMLYGHRNNPRGYADALLEFDRALPELARAMGPDELLCVTADHGNDPTYPGTDHTREYVPILVKGTGALEPATRNVDLGVRKTFADVAATAARYFGLEPWPVGASLVDLPAGD